MMASLPGNRMTVDWLQSNLNAPNLVILDASWHLPAAGRNARAEFEAKHIPDAQFFDIDALSDKATALPHMLARPEDFSQGVAALGVSNDSLIVCYDSVGLFSAARCWWNFKVMGHDKVAVLDGGLPAWVGGALPTESGPASAVNPGRFSATFRPELVKSLAEVAAGLRDATIQVADARSATRFRGEEPEPRPGVRPGHMPGAHNVHYSSLIGRDGILRSQTELKHAFASNGIDITKPIVTSCGSGITAAILTLALTELGVTHQALYDGSWADWGSSGQPVAVGSA
jgi:thiosulfate/3-mercaptopyruvate sulfurtransferase